MSACSEGTCTTVVRYDVARGHFLICHGDTAIMALDDCYLQSTADPATTVLRSLNNTHRAAGGLGRVALPPGIGR